MEAVRLVDSVAFPAAKKDVIVFKNVTETIRSGPGPGDGMRVLHAIRMAQEVTGMAGVFDDGIAKLAAAIVDWGEISPDVAVQMIKEFVERLREHVPVVYRCIVTKGEPSN